jgi:hypothetical protein
VIINLSDEATSDYALSLEAGLSEAQAALAYGDGELAHPELNEGGGFEAYSPLAELAPFSLTLIQFGS